MITSESVNNFSTISTIANEGDSTNESIQHKNEIENELERSLIDSAKKVKHDLHLEQESKLDDYSNRQPDPDSMKMFVGQIPKDWSEDDCRKLLEPYGPIYAINLLRDKETKQSKGCCFVTFYTRKSALDAQNDLHNLKLLPTCRNPIQMKPADNENKNDRKLFVGKLSKFVKESDVMNTFSNYGTVEECVILRDTNGISKGCAFVTFTTRSSASNAIRALHQSKTFEGCTTPIVVKFAEASVKEAKKLRQDVSPLSPIFNSLCTPPNPINQCLTGPTLLENSYLNLIKAQYPHHQPQQHQHYQPQQQLILSLPQPYVPAREVYPNSILLGGNNVGKLPLLPNQMLANASHLNATKLLSPESLSLASLPALTATTIPQPYSALASLTKLNSIAANSKQVEGPEGANLFIYHLPAEYNDADLVGLFMPFGNVISAKVFIDKNSNLSKCFGFVSYDNVESAQTAIRSMNGFQVLNKRLKVQLKKVRDRPY